MILKYNTKWSWLVIYQFTKFQYYHQKKRATTAAQQMQNL